MIGEREPHLFWKWDFKDSSLVDTEDMQKVVYNFFDKDNIRANLVYKASRDGFGH